MKGEIILEKITDETILEYDNVPVCIAAQYLGTSQQFIRILLQQERAPIGTAVQMSGTKWTYHVSPGLLIEYKNGKQLKDWIAEMKTLLQSYMDMKEVGKSEEI